MIGTLQLSEVRLMFSRHTHQIALRMSIQIDIRPEFTINYHQGSHHRLLAIFQPTSIGKLGLWTGTGKQAP
jgi:hypothetical protein